MTNKQKLLLAGIIVLAIFFRYYKIFSMPGGLFPDEAANGLDINLMQQGHLQPFYERGNGREALFFYMEWGSAAIFGKTPWAFHMTSALIGVLSVILCFLFTRRLFLMDADNNTRSLKDKGKGQRAINIALLASFLMAVSSWYVVLSRTAFRANLIPLFTTLTLYLLLLTYQAKTFKKHLVFAFLTGAAFALGFYSYIAYRIMVGVLGMIILWPFLTTLLSKPHLGAVKKYWKHVIIFIAGFVIFIYPIAKYFYTHPGSFIGRSGQVSIFNQSLYTYDGVQLLSKPPLGVVINVFAEVFKQSMLGYITHGDLNWRHNISDYPFLSPLVSPFFAVGLIVITILGVWYFFAPRKRKNYWKYFLLTGWFWGMLLPVVTTAEGIPHGLRSIGTIPVIFIISAWAMYEFGCLVMKLQSKIIDLRFKIKHSIVIAAFKLVVVCFVIALTLQTYYLYFVYAANSPENYYYFRSDLTSVSQYLVQRCQKDSTYLVLDKFSVQTTDFMTSDPRGNFSDLCNVPYRQVDPENAWQLSGLKPGDQIIFTESSIFDTYKFKQYHPEAHLILEYRNKFNQAIMGVYRISN